MATDRTIPLSTVELRVSEAGVGGRPLMLVHGFTGARSDFDDHLDPLASSGWHVVAPDQRGHGESSKPPSEDDYSLERFALDLIELADSLGWEEFALLGHSMGGMISQVLALRSPDRVVALTLMDTSHGAVGIKPELVEMGVMIAREQGMDAIVEASKALPDPLVTEAHLKKCQADPSYEERGERNTRTASPAMFARMLQLIGGQASRLDELAGLTMPTLVIVGDQDQPFLDPSREMAEMIPGARLAVIPDAGHSPQFEAPSAWWHAFSSFLDEVRSSVRIPYVVADT